MNINRHNYEEFFLLYVDKELSAAERKAVEVFVQENPDLQVELTALQGTVLKADDAVLDKKDWLYMEAGVSALQENLLLYADDELSHADKKSVEAMLATDKIAAAEWNILRQTKIQPDDSVVFNDKRSLYRSEGGRVIGIRWWRTAAAAAVLLGLGLWTGVAVYKNNFSTTTGTEGGIAKANNQAPGKVKNNKSENTAEVKTQPGDTQQPQNTVSVEMPENGKEKVAENADPVTGKNNKQSNNRQENNITAANEKEKPSNNLPKPYFENINRQDRNEYAVTNVTSEKNNISTSGVNDVVVKTNPALAQINNSAADPTTATAIPVVYTDENNNNDRFLYMDEEKVKRTKLGGFIRKAKRALERTTNVKTGDGLKVAGFEIALK